jgi:hypothetical protein
MIFSKIYPSWDSIVKGPQIYDAVLSCNDSMYMHSQISSSPAIVSGCEIFSPNLSNNLLRTLLALIQIEVRWVQKNISFQGVPHVGCRGIQFNSIWCHNRSKIFLPKLGPTLVDLRNYSVQIDLGYRKENKSSQGGYQLCRHAFEFVAIFIRKKHERKSTKVVATCEKHQMNRKSICIKLKPYNYDV